MHRETLVKLQSKAHKGWIAPCLGLPRVPSSRLLPHQTFSDFPVIASDFLTGVAGFHWGFSFWASALWSLNDWHIVYGVAPHVSSAPEAWLTVLNRCPDKHKERAGHIWFSVYFYFFLGNSTFILICLWLCLSLPPTEFLKGPGHRVEDWGADGTGSEAPAVLPEHWFTLALGHLGFQEGV